MREAVIPDAPIRIVSMGFIASLVANVGAARSAWPDL